MNKLAKNIFLAVIYLPIINLIVFYTFVIRAIIKLRYCPYYENPDPGELGFKFHYQLIYDIDWIIPLSMVFLIVSGLYFLIKRKRMFDVKKKHFLLSIGILVVEFLTLTSSLMVWFWD